jgi:hypothetical protein
LSTEQILKGEHRLRVSENKAVKRIFGPKEREIQIPVAALSTAWVCGRPLVGIVGSNPAGGVNISLL